MPAMWKWLHQYGAPARFYTVAGRWIPWLGGIAVLCFAYGLIGGLLLAPADYQQGDSFRIIYIHVPSATLSMSIYMMMAVSAAIAIIWKMKVAEVFAKVCAPLGASFTFLALVTGAIWGKPTWGTWWVWDARLTSELILLFLYLGVMALQSAIDDPRQSARAAGILVIVGVVNIPIIHYSVYWWNTLHQGSTLKLIGKSAIAPSMLHPLLAMLAAFYCYFGVLVLQRTRTELLLREKRSRWVAEVVE